MCRRSWLTQAAGTVDVCRRHEGRGVRKEARWIPSARELMRLTVPRRVCTQTHMDVTAEVIAEVYDRRAPIKGLEMVYEPKDLRFFQARFRPLD
jgi:tryptophanase